MSSPHDDLPQIRLARNQVLFRAINERVEAVTRSFGVQNTISLVCECSHTDCATQIELRRDEYERIREHGARFLVVSGHELLEVERVVEEKGGWLVVEKIEAGRAVALAEDPRA